MSDSLEKRITLLEDIEAIKRLKALYCFLVDDAVAGDSSKALELVDLFTDDGWADFGDFGRFEKKEGLTVFFKDIVPGLLSYTAHMVHNPVIDIEGDTARGRWYFEVPSTLKATNMAGWLQGRYDEQYIKTNGRWLWLSITARFEYATPFDQGWAKVKSFSL
ncbi:MAG: nuclear transport factor 2 family protein [Desulfatibacillaceae bacterium]|nr:nuclear transport factor 2 family protein [Desulfatibacillaceae bacterium]